MMRFEGTIPPRIAKLRMDARGYPIPWFVYWKNGKPDFRIVDAARVPLAIKRRLCWICGQHFDLIESCAFLVGPMSCINRTSAEPPSHVECAEFAVRACPFLSLPNAQRRDAALPEGEELFEVGIMHKHNPGISALWVTDWHMPFRADKKLTNAGRSEPLARNGWLFEIGDPVAIRWYREGRAATRAEVVAGIESGMSILYEWARGGDFKGSTLASLDYWCGQLAPFIPSDTEGSEHAER